MQNDSSRREALLSRLRLSGWQEGLEEGELAEHLHGKEDAEAVADALLEYWRDDPSLANYARQINGASRLFADPDDRMALLGALSRGYIASRRGKMPAEISKVYQELLFWRGLHTPEVLAYFDALSARFAELAAAEGRMGPEMEELLQSKDLDGQMKAVRRHAMDALRARLKTDLAQERIPAVRLRRFVNAVTGVGGARLANRELWTNTQHWTVLAAKGGDDQYIALRNLLEAAENGEIADRPRETLEHLESMKKSMDEATEYGASGNPEKMLGYWRSKQFTGIPDANLLRLYQNALKADAGVQAQIAQDVEVLAAQHRDLEPFEDLLHGSDGQRIVASSRQGRKDGYAGREEKKSSKIPKKTLWTAVAVLAVIIVLLLLVLSDPEGVEQERERVRQTQTPAQTQRPWEEEEDEGAAAQRSEQAESPTPSETPSPEPTPSASQSENETPAATPSETPEEEVEEEFVPEETGLEEIPVEEPIEGEVAPDASEEFPPDDPDE